jgi:hypothetical protein
MPSNPDQTSGIPEQGYWLNFSPDANAIQHEFCGQPDIKGASCPNCMKPLLRILSLSAKDPVLTLDYAKTPTIHLLYCWTCSIPYGSFSYRMKQDGSIELLQVPEPMPGTEFGLEGPYEGYIGEFPLCHVSLLPQSDSEREKLKERWSSNAEDETDDPVFEPRHQVGGYPFIYNPIKLNCPECTGAMKLLASICNDAAGNNPWQSEPSKTFVDNGGVQMFFQFCSNCSVISAAHSND